MDNYLHGDAQPFTVTPYRITRTLPIESYRDERAIAAALREMADEIEKGCGFVNWENRDD